METTSQVTSTAFEPPTADGSFMNWSRKIAQMSAMAAPMTSATLTQV
jgi:hypothetical protein